MTETVTNEKAAYPFSLLEQAAVPGEPDWLQRLRQRARQFLTKYGLPTQRDEDWKYTNVAGLERVQFEPVPAKLDGFGGEHLSSLRFADLGCQRLVFLDGHYAAQLSSSALPPGVSFTNLGQAIAQNSDQVAEHLGRYAQVEQHAFNALNTAFIRDGAYLRVARGAVVEQPIHLVFVSTGRRPSSVSHPRNLIVVERHSQVTLVESYLGASDSVCFSNPVTELICEDDAVVAYYKLQDESRRGFHIATLHLQQGRGSNLSCSSIALGGGLVRENLTAVLSGPGAETTLNGLYLVSGQQHIDNHTRMEHAAPNCSSRELYKGVLDGRARGVFHGRILVRPDAQKTDSKQTNNNLLLSDEALINTKPQLEIYADDVKCTHAATIGQLDKDALFYLRSRGIDQATARSLLIYAFAGEMIGRIRVDALRQRLDQYLFEWLPGGQSVREAMH